MVTKKCTAFIFGQHLLLANKNLANKFLVGQIFWFVHKFVLGQKQILTNKFVWTKVFIGRISFLASILYYGKQNVCQLILFTQKPVGKFCLRVKQLFGTTKYVSPNFCWPNLFY